MWWGGNPSGSRPNSFGRQHLTFDKGGKGVGDFRGIVRVWKVMWGSGAKFEQKTQVLQKRLKTEGGERILESGWQY